MSIDLQAVQGLIVVLVPVLIFLTRRYLPMIPKNLYPLLAPVIGAALEILLYQAGLVEKGNPVVGAIFGGLGTWLREVQDQLRRPFQPPAGAALLLILLLGTSGCVLLPWSSQADIADQVKLVKAQGGSGCVVIRLTGTYPGFASGTAVVIEAYDASVQGKGAPKLNFADCMKAVEPQLQRLLQQ